MGFVVQTGRRVSPSINVTPLVDVVLVLLVIFMVVTPLLMKRFPVRVPEKVDAPAAAEGQSDAIVVAIDARGRVSLNQEPLEDKALEARLRQAFATRKERVVFVTVDDAVSYGRVVEVMDHARGGGADPLVLSTDILAPTDAP
jgi:biopolymer transport protein ExbD